MDTLGVTLAVLIILAVAVVVIAVGVVVHFVKKGVNKAKDVQSSYEQRNPDHYV